PLRVSWMPGERLPDAPPSSGGEPVAFPCPYCRHAVSLKAARPGRYQPRCPACARPFRLTVPAAGEPVATAPPDVPLNPTALAMKSEAAPPGEHRTRAAPEVRVAAGERTTAWEDAAGADDGPGPKQPLTLGGYRIEKLLGRGGMGAV